MKFVKSLLMVAVLTMFTLGVANAQPVQKGSTSVEFSYTPWVSDVSSPITLDNGLKAIGIQRYVSDNISITGYLGVADDSAANSTSYGIGGNVGWHFAQYGSVVPYGEAGLLLQGNTNLRSLGINAGAGVDYFINENLSLGAGYRFGVEYSLNPTVRYRRMATGVASMRLNIWFR